MLRKLVSPFSIAALVLVFLTFVLLTSTAPATPATAQVVERCTEPPSGMRAWWRAEGDTTDFSGNHPAGTLNGATFNTGYVVADDGVTIGQAFDIEFNQSVDVADSPDWVFGTGGLDGDFSIDAWIMFENGIADTPVIASQSDGTGNLWAFVVLAGGGLAFQVDAGGVLTTFVSTDPLVWNDGQWYFVGMRRIDATINFFRGGDTNFLGLANNTGPGGTVPDITAPLRMGQLSGATNQMDGRIDELEIFDRPLQIGEFEAIEQARIAGKCTGLEPPPAVREFSCDLPAPADAMTICKRVHDGFGVFDFVVTDENGAVVAEFGMGDGGASGVNMTQGFLTISEDLPSGWNLEIECDVTNGTFVLVGRNGVRIEPNGLDVASAHCTFHNFAPRQRPTLSGFPGSSGRSDNDASGDTLPQQATSPAGTLRAPSTGDGGLAD